jgi:hypothetical protein
MIEVVRRSSIKTFYCFKTPLILFEVPIIFNLSHEYIKIDALFCCFIQQWGKGNSYVKENGFLTKMDLFLLRNMSLPI